MQRPKVILTCRIGVHRIEALIQIEQLRRQEGLNRFISEAKEIRPGLALLALDLGCPEKSGRRNEVGELVVDVVGSFLGLAEEQVFSGRASCPAAAAAAGVPEHLVPLIRKSGSGIIDRIVHQIFQELRFVVLHRHRGKQRVHVAACYVFD